jgi:hypothetical protein
MAKVTDEFIVHLKENVENLDIPNVTVENLNLVEDNNKTLNKKKIKKQTNNQQTIPEPRNFSFSTRTGSTFTASSAILIESVENISDSTNTSNNKKLNTKDNRETNNHETISQPSNSSILIEPVEKNQLKTKNGNEIDCCKCKFTTGKCEKCSCSKRGFCKEECHNGRPGQKCTLPLQNS